MKFVFGQMIFENHIDEQENNDRAVFKCSAMFAFITWIIDNNQQTGAQLSRFVID